MDLCFICYTYRLWYCYLHGNDFYLEYFCVIFIFKTIIIFNIIIVTYLFHKYIIIFQKILRLLFFYAIIINVFNFRGIVSMVSTMVSKTTSLSSSLSTPATLKFNRTLIVRFFYIIGVYYECNKKYNK